MFRVAALAYWYQFPQVFIYNLVLRWRLSPPLSGAGMLPPMYSDALPMEFIYALVIHYFMNL